MNELTPLCQLARKYGTDKGGWHLQAGDTVHNYTPAYDEMFKRRRHQVEAVLEIGINYGPSLRMWRDYFDRALIFGIDANPTCLFSEERIRCFLADQYNEQQLLTVMKEIGNVKFDLIVDDGSHVDEHQIFSAQVLLPYLASDGIYAVEDLNVDCKPELIGDKIGGPYHWEAIPVGRGLGKAFCPCGCEGGEQLLVIRHA